MVLLFFCLTFSPTWGLIFCFCFIVWSTGKGELVRISGHGYLAGTNHTLFSCSLELADFRANVLSHGHICGFFASSLSHGKSKCVSPFRMETEISLAPIPGGKGGGRLAQQATVSGTNYFKMISSQQGGVGLTLVLTWVSVWLCSDVGRKR